MARRYRLYPTPAQEAVMNRHCADARFVWNLALEQANLYRVGRSTPGNAERMRQLTEARHDSWLGEGSSSVQQAALRDFDRAMRNWWKGSHGRPTWRKKHLHNGFVIRDITWQKLNRHWAEITIPKCGQVKFRLSRPVGEHGSARVTLDPAGRWHVSLVSALQPLDRHATGAAVGIDRGVANSLATNDGTMAHAPALSSGEQVEFVRRQIAMAQHLKGSPERDLHRKVVARTCARLADRRKDWVEKSTTDLVRCYDVVAVENLNVRGMVRRPAPRPGEREGEWLPNGARAKAALNQAILAQCWGFWLCRLKEKAALCGVEVIEVPARNTSRRCPSCGHISARNRENQARFRCEKCGHEDHADTNAARNILERGLEQIKARTGPEALEAA